METGFSPKQIEQLSHIVTTALEANLSGIHSEIKGINKRLSVLEIKMEEAAKDRKNIHKRLDNMDMEIGQINQKLEVAKKERTTIIARLDKADNERKIIINRLDKADSERKVIIARLDKADNERMSIINRLDKADEERKTIIKRLDRADLERKHIKESIITLENNVIIRLDQTTKILTRVLKTEIENSFDRQTSLLRESIDHWVAPLHDRVTTIEKHLNI